MPTEELAEKLYHTYCAHVGNKAWNGDLLPSWKEFRTDKNKILQSDGWMAVAAVAILTLKTN